MKNRMFNLEELETIAEALHFKQDEIGGMHYEFELTEKIDQIIWSMKTKETNQD